MPWRRAGLGFLASDRRHDGSATPLAPHRRRTAAGVSAKVGRGLRHHAAARARRSRRAASGATGGSSPGGRGVARATARPDHRRRVSTPRWSRASRKVTSTRQRRTSRRATCSGSLSGSARGRASGVEAAPRVARQHPADRHHRQAGVAPYGGGGAGLGGPVAPAVPAGHGDLHPARGLVRRHVREVRQARALGPRAPDRPGLARRGRPAQGRIEPWTGDADRPVPGERGREVRGGGAAVARRHDPAPGQPPARLEGHPPRPVGRLLVPPAASAAAAFRGGGRGEERQRPGARPGDRGRERQAEPAQAAGLGEAAPRGARRVAVDALGGGALAPPPLGRAVDAGHHGAGRDEGGDQGAGGRAAARASRAARPRTRWWLVNRGSRPRPAIREGPVTVRSPGARTAAVGSGAAPGPLLREHRREGQDGGSEAGGQAWHDEVSRPGCAGLGLPPAPSASRPRPTLGRPRTRPRMDKVGLRRCQGRGAAGSGRPRR